MGMMLEGDALFTANPTQPTLGIDVRRLEAIHHIMTYISDEPKGSCKV